MLPCPDTRFDTSFGNSLVRQNLTKKGYLQSEVGNPVFSGALESGRFVKTWLHGTENQRSVVCNIGLDTEGPMAAMQRLLSLPGMKWPGPEGRLNEPSSHTTRSPTDRTSAFASVQSALIEWPVLLSLLTLIRFFNPVL